MRLAFLTAALSSAVAVAVLVTLGIWLATVLLGSPAPWSVTPWLMGLAALFGVATYVAEGVAHHRTEARKRATGEPWAFRGD